MLRYMMMAGVMMGTCGIASAQYPVQPNLNPYPFVPQYQTPSVMPNIFNPQQQPLSPYLNLLRGLNPGVNYYYGVRPGTMGGTGQGIGPAQPAAGGNRALFFPQLASAPELTLPREPGKGDVLPPAGHPVFFNNTMGYFPQAGAGRAGSTPGLAGIGAGRAGGR